MSTRSGAVTFSRFRVDATRGDGVDLTNRILRGLERGAFRPLVVSDGADQSAGFVELEDHDQVVFKSATVIFESVALFTFRTDELKVPAATMKVELARWCKAFAGEHGRQPGRREKRDAKSMLYDALRTRSPIVTRTVDVSWSLDSGELLIWSPSRNVVDRVQDALSDAFDVKVAAVIPSLEAERLGLGVAGGPTAPLHLAGRAVAGDDASEVEQERAREQMLRGKTYLGREFLTWLLWRSDDTDPLLEAEGEPVTVVLADALTLRGITGEIVEETVRGAWAPYSPLIRAALNRGLLIHAARLRLMHGERPYVVTLDAEHLAFKAAKLPALMSEEDDDRAGERLYLVEQLTGLVQLALETFLRARAQPEWGAVTAPAMKAWMLEGAREAA